MDFDGYRILRQVHASNRSHGFLAVDKVSAEQVLIKTLATEQRADPPERRPVRSLRRAAVAAAPP